MKRYLLLSVIIVMITLVACSSGAGKEGGLIPPVTSDKSLAGAAGQSKTQGGGGGTTPTEIPASSQSTTCTAVDTNAAAFATEVIRLVNIERVNNGLEELLSNPELTNAAQAHSLDMGCNFFMAHDSFDGTLWSDRIYSYYSGYMIGENVAAGQSTPAGVVSAWMNSPTHRANILYPDFYDIGIGFVNNPNDTTLHYYYYWTMDLGG
jgi:uncharacterized protein YkwD